MSATTGGVNSCISTSQTSSAEKEQRASQPRSRGCGLGPHVFPALPVLAWVWAGVGGTFPVVSPHCDSVRDGDGSSYKQRCLGTFTVFLGTSYLIHTRTCVDAPVSVPQIGKLVWGRNARTEPGCDQCLFRPTLDSYPLTADPWWESTLRSGRMDGCHCEASRGEGKAEEGCEDASKRWRTVVWKTAWAWPRQSRGGRIRSPEERWLGTPC